MDKVEAQKNLKRYRENIQGASMIHPCDMPQKLIDEIAVFIREQKRLVKNLESTK
ncbi:hypothetical protein [Acinetobacter tandoii]